MLSKLVKGGTLQAAEATWRLVGVPVDQALEHLRQTDHRTPRSDSGQPQSPPMEDRIADLQKESEEHARAAFQKGLQQGENNIRQQLAAQADALMKRLARSIEEISGMRQRCRSEAEQDVVQLALAIARRILYRELTVDSGAILGLVKAALEKIDRRELHHVRLHPDQASFIKKELEQMGLPQRCEVSADPSLERGAVILETSHGTLDASVETQLAEIDRGLADLVRHTT